MSAEYSDVLCFQFILTAGGHSVHILSTNDRRLSEIAITFLLSKRRLFAQKDFTVLHYAVNLFANFNLIYLTVYKRLQVFFFFFLLCSFRVLCHFLLFL